MLPAAGPVNRLIRFLAATELVDKRGVIKDVPALIRAYRWWVMYDEPGRDKPVSDQTAWNDITALIERGLLRCVQSAAPGYTAVYCLSYSLAVVRELEGLPRDLLRHLPHRRPLPETSDSPVWDLDGQGDEPAPGADDQPEESRSETALSELLDPSPSTREGFPPPPGRTRCSGTNRRSRRRDRGDHDSENSHATGLVARCRTEWERQRGRDRVPALADLTGLIRMVALAIRVAGRPGDIEQLLTTRVASAQDLAKTLTWRLGREIADARRTERPRLSPEEEAEAERRAAEHYAARQAAQRATVEAQRGPGYADRARRAVELARRIREESATGHASDRRVLEEIAARAEAERRAVLDRWMQETAPAVQAAADLEEIRRLMNGTAEDRSRARALAQVAARRARASISPGSAG